MKRMFGREGGGVFQVGQDGRPSASARSIRDCQSLSLRDTRPIKISGFSALTRRAAAA
jgi:hypothetical protein